MTPRPRSRASRLTTRVAAFGAIAALIAGVNASAPQAAGIPAAPKATTGIALDGKVGLSWRASEGATEYEVYRGTSAASITTKISPANLTATSFTDTTAANDQAYFYAVRAVSAEGPSTPSQITKVTPRAASCSTGNAIVRENCFPGTEDWKGADNVPGYPDAIEGFASASSVNAGGSVDVRVRTGPEEPYRVEIYRTGWYGGDQGRLISTISGLQGDQLELCYGNNGFDPNGLIDCSGWPVSFSLKTTADWTSGVYLIKLIREDNGNHSEIPLVVRNDGSDSDILYHIPTNTYLAYNNWLGKSLYTGWSDPPVTVTGATRAAKVSFDRPYTQATSGPNVFDYYTRTDVGVVGWLERQGYSTTYVDSENFDADADQLQDHDVFISGSHDEYWTQTMRDGAEDARDAGTSLLFLGANAAYWRSRYEPSPITGEARRVLVTYKTIESGPADPSGHSTSTYRDPAGPNQPENALLGQMYVGENPGRFFPLWVSAEQGKSRFWRYTPVANQAAGATAAIGTGIVGWEWDTTSSNGLQPAGLQTLAATPVDGYLTEGNGASRSVGNTTQKTTMYTAPSGAIVFASGTNNWWRGLAHNVFDEGEPNSRIQQATINLLDDMGAQPTTITSGMELDLPGPPAIEQTAPTAGAGNVPLTSAVSFTFDRELDPASVDDGDITLTENGVGPVPGKVTWNAPARTLTFQPDDALESFAAYTAQLTTGLQTWKGSATAAQTLNFSTGPGTPPVVTVRTPSAGAVAISSDASITARFDRRLDPATVTTSSFRVRPTAGGPYVAATVSYPPTGHTVTLDPTARLNESTSYTVEATTAIQARGDNTPMTAPATWSFTTNQNLKVSSTWPGNGATGIAPLAAVRATLSRAIDAAGVPESAFTLETAGGSDVPGHVSYDATERTATLIPTAPLAPNTTYTASISGDDVHAADGAPLDTMTWSFTTAASAPPAPELTGLYPADAAVGISPSTTVRASFDIPLDPATVTALNVTLTPDGGAPVATTVSYDAPNRKVILKPSAGLQPNTHYTATVTTGVRSTTGAPLPVTRTWGFNTANCPCNLITNQTPEWSGPVQDFRPGPGPFSYELGTKVEATTSSVLVALRYWKDPTETGTHVGRVWSAAGALIATVTFQNETASGWQRQALTTPVALNAGQRYVISVGFNSTYVRTYEGFATQLTSGPLRSVADGSNGVYAESAGQFPTGSWRSSNYFVDAVVRLPSEPATGPQVSVVTPLGGSTGVSRTGSATATFNARLDPSTVNGSTVRLTGPGGATVPATVSYDDDEKRVTLNPSVTLEAGTTYTAQLTTGIRSEAEVAMASAYSWSFTTVPPSPPAVTQTSPVDSATGLAEYTNVTATFDQAMSAASINTGSFKLTEPGGATVAASVSYDSLTRTATLNPDADLAPNTTYTAELTGAVQSGVGLNLPAHAWTFTTSDCPCSLFGDAPLNVAYPGLSTANGRPGTPWSLEMGVKVQVTQPARIQALRFHKDASETGSHTGRVWTSSGALLATVEFENETASGWQEATLDTPLPVTPGQVYVVSVGLNSAFGMTTYVFTSPITDGPLSSVADGANGVFADAAGAFPTQHWGSSNYGMDVVVK